MSAPLTPPKFADPGIPKLSIPSSQLPKDCVSTPLSKALTDDPDPGANILAIPVINAFANNAAAILFISLITSSAKFFQLAIP